VFAAQLLDVSLGCIEIGFHAVHVGSESLDVIRAGFRCQRRLHIIQLLRVIGAALFHLAASRGQLFFR
jgi:hypothetical protein